MPRERVGGLNLCETTLPSVQIRAQVNIPQTQKNDNVQRYLMRHNKVEKYYRLFSL